MKYLNPNEIELNDQFLIENADRIRLRHIEYGPVVDYKNSTILRPHYICRTIFLKFPNTFSHKTQMFFQHDTKITNRDRFII